MCSIFIKCYKNGNIRKLQGWSFCRSNIESARRGQSSIIIIFLKFQLKRSFCWARWLLNTLKWICFIQARWGSKWCDLLLEEKTFSLKCLDPSPKFFNHTPVLFVWFLIFTYSATSTFIPVHIYMNSWHSRLGISTTTVPIHLFDCTRRVRE